MFGFRWISAVSLRWHRSPNCPVLRAQRTRSGWRPFLITAGYGRNFYLPCGRCASDPAPTQPSPGGGGEELANEEQRDEKAVSRDQQGEESEVPRGREGRCNECGKDYELVWFAPNDLWNRITGSPSGFLCPCCFQLQCAAVGQHLVWRAGAPGELETAAPQPGAVLVELDRGEAEALTEDEDALPTEAFRLRQVAAREKLRAALHQQEGEKARLELRLREEQNRRATDGPSREAAETRLREVEEALERLQLGPDTLTPDGLKIVLAARYPNAALATEGDDG